MRRGLLLLALALPEPAAAGQGWCPTVEALREGWTSMAQPWGPLSTDRVVVVDKACGDLECLSRGDHPPQVLVLYREAGGWTVRNRWEAHSGWKAGNKSQRGDHRTPAGLYFNWAWKLNGDPRFGGWALVLSYPGPQDLEGRTSQDHPGCGVTVHSGLVRDTDGCIRLVDPDLPQDPAVVHQRPMVDLRQVVGSTPGTVAFLLLPFMPAGSGGAVGATWPSSVGLALDGLLASASVSPPRREVVWEALGLVPPREPAE